MNALIQQMAELGQSISLYGTINTAAWVLALAYSVWHGKKLGFPLWKVLIILAVAYYGLSAIQSALYSIVKTLKYANFLEMETVVNSIVRAVAFLPLLAIPVALVLRLKWSQVCDVIAFYPLLTSAIGQLACIFPGCCRGYQMTFGIYNVKTGQYHFPVQILETILTLAIFAYLLYQLYRRKYTSNGMLYPEMMTLYGLMRFICEALRDNEKIFFGCSGVSLHALAMFIIGFAILLHKEKKNKNAELNVEPISEDTAPSTEMASDPTL